MKSDARSATCDPETVAAGVARGLAAEDALLLASGGAGLIAGLRAVAGGGAVVVQRGHAVDVGGSPLRLAAMAGCAVVEVGLADRCGAAELAAALDGAAAGLLVDTPAAARDGLLDLKRFLWACHAARRPVLVHSRRPPPWIFLLDAGADLVSVDLGPSLGRPGGLLVGRAELVARARAELEALPALLAPGPELAAAVEGLVPRPGAAA